MQYKEFLRVRKALIIYAIVILAIALAAFAGTELVYASHAKVNVSSASSARTVVASAAAGDTVNVEAPGVDLRAVNHSSVPLEVLFVLPAFVTSILAMILGCFLPSENCGHLEIAWTRPATRSGYALRGMLVDAAGIAAAYLFALAICALYVTALGFWRYFHADAQLAINIVRFVLYPFAWYGLIAALTASLRGGAGIAVGAAWIATQVSLALKALHFPPIIHGILVFINYFNPLLYGGYSVSGAAVYLALPTSLAAIGGLLGLILAGSAAALLQWRSLEA